MNINDGYQIWGMHLIWWFVWMGLLTWIFVSPYDIPGQRKKKDSPLNILQKRFASGNITKEEYFERKKMLSLFQISLNTHLRKKVVLFH